jgi:putative protease
MPFHELELLAPAGKMDALQSVVEAGADAVYLGGKRFNMRALRPDFNFTDADIKDAVDFCTRGIGNFTSQ